MMLIESRRLINIKYFGHNTHFGPTISHLQCCYKLAKQSCNGKFSSSSNHPLQLEIMLVLFWKMYIFSTEMLANYNLMCCNLIICWMRQFALRKNMLNYENTNQHSTNPQGWNEHTRLIHCICRISFTPKHAISMNPALLMEVKQMTRKVMFCSKVILSYALFTLLHHGKDGRFLLGLVADFGSLERPSEQWFSVEEQ